MDLYVKIIGKSENRIFINNSIYGDLNNITYDHKVPFFNIIKKDKQIPLKSTYENINKPLYNKTRTFINNYSNNNEQLYTYNIYGNTCDSLDIICKNTLSPELNIDDELCFPEMGAYSIVSSTNFNGIPTGKIIIKN